MSASSLSQLCICIQARDAVVFWFFCPLIFLWSSRLLLDDSWWVQKEILQPPLAPHPHPPVVIITGCKSNRKRISFSLHHGSLSSVMCFKLRSACYSLSEPPPLSSLVPGLSLLASYRGTSLLVLTVSVVHCFL